MKEGLSSYLNDPDKYCDNISTLIQNSSDEWQTVWQAAIKELFHNSELFQNPANNINAINSLLKVIEKAFKERVYRLRVQAFECWRFFIVVIDTCDVSDKLLNVLLIPLCASNHSVFEVLRAKLKTWTALLDSNLVRRQTIMKKGIPNLLKILYGPHALRQASEFDDLVDVCGNIYLKMLEKCTASETIDIILGFLERAVPILANNENTRNIANQIWTNALEHISKNNWSASQFNYLIITVQNLVSLSNTGGNALINSFLTILVEIYSSFPVGYLNLNMALFSRCLFHVPQSNILNLMKRFMKKCQDESLFFKEIVLTWHTCVEEYKKDLFKFWFAAKTCFLEWDKRAEAVDSTWVILLPVKYLHNKWDSSILEQLRFCYDEILPSNQADVYVKTLCTNLDNFIAESKNISVSLLNACVDLCKIILQSPKRFDDNRYVKLVLLSIFHKISSHSLLTNSAYKSFAPKFVATVLYFLKEFPESANELAPITRLCSSFVDSEKISTEFPVVQLIKKFADAEGNDDAVLKPHNGVGVTSGAKTNMRTSFLARLSSSAEKNKSNSETAAKIPSTPKSLNSMDEDNDVQFVAIKPRTKNSPMTEHQKEVATSRSYIPALYADLSQSQSHSQSQSESVSLLSNKTPAPVISGIEYFEEDANLPPERNEECPGIENTPTLDSSNQSNLGKQFALASKKSLFKDKTNSDDKIPVAGMKNITHLTCDKNITVNEKNVEVASDDSKKETSLVKRRSTRFFSVAESTPPKRSKRSSENLDQTELKKTPSEPKERAEEKKKVGRPKKNVSISPEVEEVNIVDSESQTLFVSTPSRLEKLSTISSPIHSLMNVKSTEDGAKTRRKSLKSKGSVLPARSPIVTRKRKSSVIENNELKKASTGNEHSSTSSVLIRDKINPVVSMDTFTADNRARVLNEPLKEQKSVDCENDSSVDMNNSSVVIVEPDSRPDVISIIDTESQSIAEKSVELKNASPIKISPVDIPDESTFFEAVEVAETAERETCQTKKSDEGKNEKIFEPSETGKSKKSSLNESFPEKLALEESQIENIIKFNETAEQTTTNNGTKENYLESNVENQSSNDNASEKSSPKKVSSPIKNQLSLRKAAMPENDERLEKGDTPSPEETNATKNEPINDRPDISSVKKKLIDELGDKNENQSISVDQTKTNTSPISNNTRTLKIMKMACDSQNLSKPKHFGKSTKSPLSSSFSNLRTTSTNQRTMKILMANNSSVEKPRSSPTHAMPQSAERLKYYPKECTSPGILKKPDLNGSISSPKSAKFVNFAEQLTLTRTFDANEENYFDSCSSDDRSNSNLINDDEATSQETLYSPLLNCSDDVKNIINRLSLGKAAVGLFHRMGIKTVGHLASISTLTAKSLPAGDNRLQRLRKALKDYDEWRTSFYESKGLRIPSARRRLLCRSPDSILEVTSLIELLDEAESIDLPPNEGENSETPNQNRLPTVVIAKLSEENCPSLLNKDEIITRLEEQMSPTKVNKDAAKSPSKDRLPIAVRQEDLAPIPLNSTSIDESAVDKSPVDISISVPVLSNKSPAATVHVEPSPAAAFSVTSIKNISIAHADDSSVSVEMKSMIKNVVNTETAPTSANLADVDGDTDSPVESIQQDVSEDTDFVCTDDDQSCGKAVEPKTHLKLAASCMYEVSLGRPPVDSSNQASPITPSPEIITVDNDEDANVLPNEDVSDKEHSMAIFSPDVTSRTVNRETEIQSQCVSQSLIEASKNQLNEGSMFRIDETAPAQIAERVAPNDPGDHLISNADERPSPTSKCEGSESAFSQLLSTFWEPFLTDRLRQIMIPNEKVAFNEYTAIIRKNVTKLRELREAGLIDIDKLRDCGFVDFVNEINLLRI